MFDLVDLLLLRRGVPANDRTLAFRRIDGNHASNVIYFLPWQTPFAFARHAGLAPLNFLACYEMPSAIVSLRAPSCACRPCEGSWTTHSGSLLAVAVRKITPNSVSRTAYNFRASANSRFTLSRSRQWQTTYSVTS